MKLKEPNHPHLEMVEVDTLRANPTNARTHNRKQIAQIKASIARFGFLVPLIIAADNVIIAGHARYQAAKMLEMRVVPAIRADFVSDDDRRAFAITENRLAELSGWDQDVLSAELNDLFNKGYDFEVTGFSAKDLDFSIPEVSVAVKPERVEVPDPAARAVSRLGDLWHIGPHRLYNGDARAAESYEALLAGELATMVFADPPYGVRISGHVSGLGAVQHREFEMMSGEQTPAELTAFLRQCFRMCARFTVPASIHFHCMDWRHMREILDAGDGVYTELKNLAIWNKGTGSMGSFYRSQHELIFIFKSGRGKHINTFLLGDSGRYRTNVWDYPGASAFRKGGKKDLADHPTIKNTAMVIDAILDCSNRGDLILDPFSGSGTTILAAHKAGRRGAALEIDPLYVDTALDRISKACDLEVTHDDGRSFADVAAARAEEASHGER